MAISENEEVAAESVENGLDDQGDVSEPSDDVSGMTEEAVEQQEVLAEADGLQLPEDEEATLDESGEESPAMPSLSTPAFSAAEQAGAGNREIGISSVVHLMGLATKKHLDTVEQQIAAVSTKITLLSTKVEKINSQLQSMQSAAALDRLDAQLSDIQKALKQISRASGASLASATPPPMEKRSAPKIIVSKPQEKEASEEASVESSDGAGEVQAAETDAVDDGGQTDSDIEFQRAQAEKVRKEVSDK